MPKASGRPRIPARKTLVHQLDAVFSAFIKSRDARTRGRCPFHHLTYAPIEHCFHFITRAKHSVRWNPKNAVGSCAGCNLRYEHDQTFIDYVFEWYKREYGPEAWDELKREANTIVKRSRTDLMALRDALRADLGVGA